MPNTMRTLKARSATGGVRVTALALAAGFVSLALGPGEAAAATGGQGDVFAAGAAARLAESTQRQAEHQHRAAEVAAARRKVQHRSTELRTSRHTGRTRTGGWVKPVSVPYTLTAGYGRSGRRWANEHSGQDFAVPTGTPVHAVHGGTVVKAGANGAGDGAAYGNAIVIKHDAHTYSQYAHLSVVQVRKGQRVRTGQQIALSGSTGNSTGPHLHFEIRSTPNYGSAKEPLAILRHHGVIL